MSSERSIRSAVWLVGVLRNAIPSNVRAPGRDTAKSRDRLLVGLGLLCAFGNGSLNAATANEIGLSRQVEQLRPTHIGIQSYQWRPFDPVQRPPFPLIQRAAWARNPIDHFIGAEHDARQLAPRPEAPKAILLRRVYLDLIGLSPTPEALEAFEADSSPLAYEKVVDRLLADPRYGERWGRHWMDVWRYSDWAGWSGGGQIRDSQPHIWRWRDWIIESLNRDKGYDQMLVEMLAADELAPENPDALRATGFLVRNFKLLSREQWLEDTLNHTSKAFLGLTMHCAKCHEHKYDPVSQNEYYQMRAIFEPHRVRIDRVPGQFDTKKDGLVRVYDADLKVPTWFFNRGDERQPDTNHVVLPGVPQFLGGSFDIHALGLPRLASMPDKRRFVIKDRITSGREAVDDARRTLNALPSDDGNAARTKEAEWNLALVEARQTELLAVLRAEELEDAGANETDEWQRAAGAAVVAQRKLAWLEAKETLRKAKQAQAAAEKKSIEAAEAARLASDSDGGTAPNDKRGALARASDKAAKELDAARQKTAEAAKAVADAQTALNSPAGVKYKPRAMETYPTTTTGRRLALARWIANRENPLTARVAMNHLWLRHFGRGIVPTPADFGRNGRPPSHPQLLDWLAAELMSNHWQMKSMHRLIVTSSTYRMASTFDAANAQVDPDDTYLWRMPSRRIEAELVRDNVLHVSGDLDGAMGGPEIDHAQGLTSKRRSVYLRIAAEKEVEFLKIFDGPSVTECYVRRPSVMPQQALALANSGLTLAEARKLAARISGKAEANSEIFIAEAFRRILARHPSERETRLCKEFLNGTGERNASSSAVPVSFPAKASVGASALNRRENLILVLFNHSDFVTIR